MDCHGSTVLPETKVCLCQVCTVVLIQHGFYEFDYTFVIIWKGETMYGGAWRATVHGVAKNQIRLKQQSTHQF